MGRVSTEPKTSLRKAMNMRGVTAARLSEMTNIPMGSINSIAAGFSKCSTKRAAVFADALRVTPEELRDITANTDFLAKPAKPKPTRRNALHAPANKDGIVVQPPMSETEKLRLYMNQLERRVRALEAQVKELADD